MESKSLLMSINIINYASSFPEWSAKDRYLLYYFIKRYTAIAISSSNIWDLGIWNKRRLTQYEFVLSKDKCPIIFINRDNLSFLFTEEIENYLSGCISILFFSTQECSQEVEYLKSQDLRGVSIEKLLHQFSRISLAVEKVFDDIEGHKTFIYYR